MRLPELNEVQFKKRREGWRRWTSCEAEFRHVAVGQHQWCHVGVGAPPILVYFSGDWDVHSGYGILTYGHVAFVYIMSHLAAACHAV